MLTKNSTFPEHTKLLKLIFEDADLEVKAQIAACRLLKGDIRIVIDKNTLDYHQSIRNYKVKS